MTQPPSCSSGSPHSGQNRPLAALPAGNGVSPVWVFHTFSKTLAMASGQEVTASPGCRMVEGQRIPFSW